MTEKQRTFYAITKRSEVKRIYWAFKREGSQSLVTKRKGIEQRRASIKKPDQLHPVMMASISFICFLFLLGLTGAHPVADESMKSRNLVNGQENEPRMQYDSIKALPPVNGMGDEPVRDLMNAPLRGAHPVADESMKSRNLVNGQENEPRMQYDSIKALPPVNGMGDEPVRDLMNAPPPPPRPLQVWTKYSSDTTWCTVNGRSLLYSSTTDPIDKVQCQQLCVESNSRCSAVEFWEEYNYACFECTDLSLAEPYTNENDLAYPVYVWVRMWTKYSSDTTWCTVNGRSLLYSSTTDPIDEVQCQQLCLESNSRCSAVEFWEEYNYACFECTDLSLAEPYTNENDLAYPVYVWVRKQRN
nr:uncharacterized protein LOC131777614 [Pocillopora verrucosa]